MFCRSNRLSCAWDGMHRTALRHVGMWVKLHNAALHCSYRLYFKNLCNSYSTWATQCRRAVLTWEHAPLLKSTTHNAFLWQTSANIMSMLTNFATQGAIGEWASDDWDTIVSNLHQGLAIIDLTGSSSNTLFLKHPMTSLLTFETITSWLLIHFALHLICTWYSSKNASARSNEVEDNKNRQARQQACMCTRYPWE